MKHSNIAIFIPHIGCPNMCSFCNQNSISGAVKTPTIDDVNKICDQALIDLKENAKNSEIAFFGGSFTAIDYEYMENLLKTANKFISKDKFCGIRISTRPDAINKQILEILKKYNVTAIELGVQSLDEQVLELNHRGHSLNDVEEAVKLIKQYNFSLGLQMMVGLYGDNKERLYKTTEKIIRYNPDTVRIYPTVIIKDTLLEKLFNQNKYKPLSLSQAVELTSEIMEKFMEKNINMIRVGLHASDLLEQDMIAGPYHPAFRDLCEGEIYYKKCLELLKNKNQSEVILGVNNKCVSKLVGQNKINIEKLKKLGYKVKIKQIESLKPFDVVLVKDV